MSSQAHAKIAADLSTKILSNTLGGSTIASGYLDSLIAASSSFHTERKASQAALNIAAKPTSQDMAEFYTKGTSVPQYSEGGYRKENIDSEASWLKSSGQSKYLNMKGATLVLRKRIKSYNEIYGPGVGPGPETYLKSLGDKKPGDFTYSTISFSKDYSYNQLQQDRKSLSHHSKQGRESSGIGGILGMVVATTKRVIEDPSRLFTGIDPASTKLGNEVFGTDKTPIVNFMGGPSQSSYAFAEEDTGREIKQSTKDFYKIADMVAAIWGGGAAASALGGVAGSAAGGAGTLAGDVAAGAASGAVKGAVGVASTGSEDLSAVGKGALGGAVTGAVKGAYGNLTGETSLGSTSTSTGTPEGGKNMSLWDQVTDYFTEDDGGYDWGNIAGTALSAYGAYTKYQGARQQRDAAQDAADLGQRAYEFSEGQQEEQFGLAKDTLANRIMQQQQITAERGETRGMLEGYLQDSLSGFQGAKEQAGGYLSSQFDQGLSDLTTGFDQAEGALGRGISGLRDTYQSGRRDLTRGLWGLEGAYRTGRGQLGRGISDLSTAYRSGMGSLNQGISGLKGSRDQSRAALDPLIQESDLARQQQMGLLGIGGYEASLEKTPGYEFRMEEAMRGAERGLSSVGGSRSGRALTELQGRAEGLAGQYFDTHMNQLGQFSQAGIGARGQLPGLEQGYGQSIAGIRQGMAGYSQAYGQNLANMRQGIAGYDQAYGQGQAGLRQGMAGYTQDYGQSLMAAQQGLSNLAASRGQLLSGRRQQYGDSMAGLEMQQAGLAGQAMQQSGQLQAGLVPRADMFNSQFGQLSPGMAQIGMGGLQDLGQAQYNYGSGMSELYGVAATGLEDIFGKGTMKTGMNTY